MNNPKKDILFIMNNLNCGGAEKALVSLFQLVDYSRYNIDLLLIKKEGIFLNQVPSEVTILNEPLGFSYFDMSIKKAIYQNFIKLNFKIIYNRICAGFIFKNEKNRALSEQKNWKYIRSCTNKLEKKYDVAIGFLEKTPIYYCVDKVNANTKIGFIHNDYNQLGMDSEIDFPYFNKLNKLVTVSEECKLVLEEIFPLLKSKLFVLNNIISAQTINNLSKEPIKLNENGLTLMSVGRLNYQKGYDLALDSCEILVKKGVVFKWYIIGEGEERNFIEKKIIEKKLQDYFILLGVKDNPYAYLAKADIFVHTARFEGYGIVIAEAKIIGLPMVITDFNIAKSHIDHGKNGLIAKLNSNSISNNLLYLIDNKLIREEFSSALLAEKLDTQSEIVKFYDIIN